MIEVTPIPRPGTTNRTEATRRKVAAHRQRLRAQGLRPIQIWVPDVRSATFREQAHQQSAAVANSPHAADDQAFIDGFTTLLDDPSDPA